MLIRATTRYRNELILKRRKQLEMNQKKYATFLDIPFHSLQIIESLRWPKNMKSHGANMHIKHVGSIAADIGCAVEDIFPDWLKKQNVENSVKIGNIEFKQLTKDHVNLLEYENKNKRIGYDIERLHKIINLRLNNREKQVIEMRFGLIDGADYTLREVGQKINTTVERVRQIENTAIRKLRYGEIQDYLLGEKNHNLTQAEEASFLGGL